MGRGRGRGGGGVGWEGFLPSSVQGGEVWVDGVENYSSPINIFIIISLDGKNEDSTIHMSTCDSKRSRLMP